MLEQFILLTDAIVLPPEYAIMQVGSCDFGKPPERL